MTVRGLGGAGLAWAASVLAIISTAIGIVFMVIGGLDYPALATASWFVTLSIIMGLLLVVACAWNGWSVLSQAATGHAPDSPSAEPALLGSFLGLALAASLGIVVARIPANGLGNASVLCPRGTRCYLQYGNSQTELTVAAALFFMDALLFGAVGVWALRRSTGREEAPS
jgi:hypothetical protein